MSQTETILPLKPPFLSKQKVPNLIDFEKKNGRAPCERRQRTAGKAVSCVSVFEHKKQGRVTLRIPLFFLGKNKVKQLRPPLLSTYEKKMNRCAKPDAASRASQDDMRSSEGLQTPLK